MKVVTSPLPKLQLTATHNTAATKFKGKGKRLKTKARKGENVTKPQQKTNIFHMVIGSLSLECPTLLETFRHHEPSSYVSPYLSHASKHWYQYDRCQGTSTGMETDVPS
jgi:hypothetical protein